MFEVEAPDKTDGGVKPLATIAAVTFALNAAVLIPYPPVLAEP